jgi:hypothetical protein
VTEAAKCFHPSNAERSTSDLTLLPQLELTFQPTQLTLGLSLLDLSLAHQTRVLNRFAVKQRLVLLDI